MIEITENKYAILSQIQLVMPKIIKLNYDI